MERIAVARCAQVRARGGQQQKRRACGAGRRLVGQHPHPDVKQACCDSGPRGSRGGRASVRVQRSTSSVRQAPRCTNTDERGVCTSRKHKARSTKMLMMMRGIAAGQLARRKGPREPPFIMRRRSLSHYRAHRPAARRGSRTLALRSVDPPSTCPCPRHRHRPCPAPRAVSSVFWLLASGLRQSRSGGPPAEGKIDGKVVAYVVEGSSYDL